MYTIFLHNNIKVVLLFKLYYLLWRTMRMLSYSPFF